MRSESSGSRPERRSARSRSRRSWSRCRQRTRRCGRDGCRRGRRSWSRSRHWKIRRSEGSLLKAAARGLVPLRDACIAARARREDEATRSARQQAARSFQMWPTPDGMVEGHFRVTPQVGGRIKACIEHGTRRRFRAARSDGTREPQDRYAADAFADAVLGDPACCEVRRVHRPRAHRPRSPRARPRARRARPVRSPASDRSTSEWVRTLLGDGVRDRHHQEGQGHHDRRASRAAHPRRAAHRDDRLRTRMHDRRVLRDASTSSSITARSTTPKADPPRGGTSMWVCSIHHTRKTQGWILGPPDPDHRETKTRPHRHRRAA